MCARTRFKADQAWRQRLEKLHHLATSKLLPDYNPLARIDAVTWNTFFAMSKPIVVICIWTAPLM